MRLSSAPMCLETAARDNPMQRAAAAKLRFSTTARKTRRLVR
jgi:hypothetical protein